MPNKSTSLTFGIYNLPRFGTETDYNNSFDGSMSGWIVINGKRVASYTRIRGGNHITGTVIDNNLRFICNSVSDFVIAYFFYNCGYQDGYLAPDASDFPQDLESSSN